MKNEIKTVVVTGGARGLGLSIAKSLSSEYKIVVVSRNPTTELDALLSSKIGEIYFEKQDLANTNNIKNLAKKIYEEHGRIYGLVNNAAIGKDGILATMHDKDIAEIVRVNIEAPILLAKYFLRPMLLQANGRIINISSIIAKTGYSGLAAYGASKAALEGFTKSLSREVGKMGITVNCIAPGFMETEMTKGLDDNKLEIIKRRSAMKLLVTPDDVAKCVHFLMSDNASKVTGSVFTIDAGSSA